MDQKSHLQIALCSYIIWTYLLNVTFMGSPEPDFVCKILFLFFLNLSSICNLVQTSLNIKKNP